MNWCDFEYGNTITSIVGFILLAAIIVYSFRRKKKHIVFALLFLGLYSPFYEYIDSVTNILNI